jgi:hypothetical protein
MAELYEFNGNGSCLDWIAITMHGATGTHFRKDEILSQYLLTKYSTVFSLELPMHGRVNGAFLNYII